MSYIIKHCHNVQFLQALEEQIKQLEKESAHWKDEYTAVEQRKESELQVSLEYIDILPIVRCAAAVYFIKISVVVDNLWCFD